MRETVVVCPLEDLSAGRMRLVELEDIDRSGRVHSRVPRHGSVFDLHTGRPLSLPAYEPVERFRVHVEVGEIRLEVE
jgi:nitrite reductase/ring-hydroxylating ferredoxin subunit